MLSSTALLPRSGACFPPGEPRVPIVLVEVKHVSDSHRVDKSAAHCTRGVAKKPIATAELEALVIWSARRKGTEAAKRIRCDPLVVHHHVGTESHRCPVLFGPMRRSAAGVRASRAAGPLNCLVQVSRFAAEFISRQSSSPSIRVTRPRV